MNSKPRSARRPGPAFRAALLRGLIALALLAPAAPAVFAQFPSGLDSPGATEQLRLGVQAYHRGRYAEALLLFEKTLAYAPDSALCRYWLGRAYYKAGYEATALRAWEPLALRPDAPPELSAKIEALRASRSFGSGGLSGEPRYVEAARFEGIKGKQQFFQRPSALLPNKDGSFYVAAHGSNELLLIDPNGVIRERVTGGLRGLDRPFGLASLPDGTLFITEFNGDRVARLPAGDRLGAPAVFGAKGRGEGQLLGPQSVACDADGYIYVGDYGNARVVKFDPEGRFILSFGAKDGDFPGLASPSGIVAAGGAIYVADSFRRALYAFDPSGNYLGAHAEGELRAPEGLAPWKGGAAILVADTDRILSFDLATETLSPLYQAPDKKARIVSVVADHNGNLLAADFDASAVSVLTESPLLAAGYELEIERIVSDSFPRVLVDVSVKDRTGAPVVGLGLANFHLAERTKVSTKSDEGGKTVLKIEEKLVPVEKLELLGTGTLTTSLRVLILAERSPAMAPQREAARAALADLAAALSAGRAGLSATSLGLASAGKSPALELPLKAGAPDLPAYLRALASPASEPGRFDLGLRLAATSLLPAEPRDAVVYVGTGIVEEASFAGTTLSELGALLENSGIRFFGVILGSAAPSPALRYLAERTGGALYAASRARGLGDLAAELRGGASGRYRLAFESKADSGFGRAYLGVAAEAYLYKKSGREELGYYAPLR
ncbi:MAG: 6-bladed beta-propeller [Spirochaetaceae bacterium]|nr:6-bladed beta-propeller [Spirochaetaceae bacterium]